MHCLGVCPPPRFFPGAPVPFFFVSSVVGRVSKHLLWYAGRRAFGRGEKSVRHRKFRQKRSAQRRQMPSMDGSPKFSMPPFGAAAIERG